MISAILAHQGGWDEAVFVIAPLVIFGVLLLLARRRVDRLDDPDRPETGASTPDDPDR